MVIEKNPLLVRARDIECMVPYWEKVDAIVEGQDAIKAGGTCFLPAFPDEKNDDYNFRLSLSKFTNIYRDVLEGLSTKPFEEEITLIGGEEVPESVREFVEDVDGFGSNISTFSTLTFFNGINSAIDWIFVDYPIVDNTRTMTVAEANQQNIKPFWSHVLAKNIYEVRTSTIGSKRVISYIRIYEPSDKVNHVRVFERVGKLVTWTLYKEVPEAKKVEDQVVKIDEGVLTISVIPLVPFVTGRRDGNTFKFFPAMKDAADLQISLYQNESALEYIKTMACYPMLAANGMKPVMSADGKTPLKVAIGPMRVLYGVPDGSGNHGEWRFIEPNANSMEFLQKNIDKTKQDLRELGRQPLTALSTQLTTVTTSIAAGKARSAVSAWALGLKDALENALLITMLWMKDSYEPEVNVYTGFDNIADNNIDLEELGKSRERGDLSLETYWFELKRRKVLSPEFNSEDEYRRLLDEIPTEEDLTQPNSDEGGATIG